MTDKQLTDIPADLLSPGEAAKLLHVTTKTIQRMGDRGEIAYVRLPSGHRRYSRADVYTLRASSSPVVPSPHGSAGDSVAPERQAS